MCLEYQHTQLHEATLHYYILHKSLNIIGADIFMINSKNLIFVVDYCSMSPIVKNVASLSAQDIVQAIKMTFIEFGLPERIVSDVGMSFTSQTLEGFHRKLNILQSITSLYHYQSNCQVETCIKFVKYIIKTCTGNNQDTNLALLQIQSTSMGPGLPSTAEMLFNRPIQSLLPQITRAPINIDNDNVQFKALESHQGRLIKKNYTKYPSIFSAGCTVAV